MANSYFSICASHVSLIRRLTDTFPVQMRTMKANYKNDAGDIDIIRPLCYVRESQTREFSYTAGLPV